VKILHVFSTFKAAGPQLRFLALANQWGPTYEHVVIAMDGNYEAMDRVLPSIKISQFNFVAFKGNFFKQAQSIFRTVRQIRPNLILTYNWGSIEWPMLFPIYRTPIVHIEDGFGPEEAQQLLARRSWTRRIVFKYGVEKLIVVSSLLNDIAKEHWRVPNAQLSFIQNGVDLSRFSASSLKIPTLRAAPNSSDALVITTIAGLRPEKRIDRLLDAVALLSPSEKKRVCVWIVGDGALMNKLREQAIHVLPDVAVTFFGARSDTEALLAESDIYALSSDTEQAPISILEAMACGKAVAAVDVGDIKAMVSDSNRTFIQGKDALSLARSISSLMGDLKLKDKIGLANRLKVEENFDSRASARAWLEVIEKCAVR
jgi:glycosyltransferase involved in cell wall biosynthesis